MFNVSCNKDLIWVIGNKVYLESAVCFLKRFESALCLFSTSVDQLYSNYEIVPANNEANRMVAMPNPYAYHDTFSLLNSDAVVPTGIRVIPSEVAGRSGSSKLLMLYKSSKSDQLRSIPLAQGLKKLEKHFGKGRFLPVMVNNDLQFINGTVPAMHLHRVEIDKLDHLSEFQRHDLQSTIARKMNRLTA